MANGLPSCTQSPGFISSTAYNPTVIPSECHSSTWELEAGGFGVQGHPWLRVATLRLGVELDPQSRGRSKTAFRVWWALCSLSLRFLPPQAQRGQALTSKLHSRKLHKGDLKISGPGIAMEFVATRWHHQLRNGAVVQQREKPFKCGL